MSSLRPSSARPVGTHRWEVRMVPEQVDQLGLAVARTRRTSEAVRVRPAGFGGDSVLTVLLSNCFAALLQRNTVSLAVNIKMRSDKKRRPGPQQSSP